MSTKKPHEATLVVMKMDKERKCLVEDDMRMVAVLRGWDSAEWERFLVASPNLARALLRAGVGVGSEWHLMSCPDHVDCSRECVVARSALRNAGVLP